MKKTYRGSCHCGAVRFEADIDLAEDTVRCNCSMCRKGRNWLAAVKGDAFRLLTGDAFYAVNVACPDDVEPAELAATPVVFVDGLHDDFKNPPKETRHL